MLIDQIKKANMLALKNKDEDQRAAFSVAINKYMLASIEKKSRGEEISDNDFLQIIQKMVKELQDEKAMYIHGNNLERAARIEHQIDAISIYLPQLMSEDEIRAVIATLEDKSMKTVMAYFKANYAGKVDMSLVSRILRS